MQHVNGIVTPKKSLGNLIRSNDLTVAHLKRNLSISLLNINCTRFCDEIIDSHFDSSKAPRDVPTCDFWKREGLLSWTTDSDSGDSDSDCEEQELCTYKVCVASCPPCFSLWFLTGLAWGFSVKH